MSTFDDLSDSEVLAAMEEEDDIEIVAPTTVQSKSNISVVPPSITTTQKPLTSQKYRQPVTESEIAEIRLQLQKAESARDMYRGEVAVLRSNMERSSQAHISQIKTVRETLASQKQEQEEEIENVKRELEALKSERAFFQNDLVNLQQKNKSLERRLHDQQIAAARLKQQQHQQKQMQNQDTKVADENEDEDEDLFVGETNNNHSAGLPPTRKRPRQNLPDSFMDGFVLPPSQSSHGNLKRSTRKPNIRLIDSSSEKSSNKSSPTSQQQQNLGKNSITHNIHNHKTNDEIPLEFDQDIAMIDEIEPQMESTRIESASNPSRLPPQPPQDATTRLVRVPVINDKWKSASEAEKIFELTTAIIGHQVAGVPEPTLDFLSRFSVQIGDTPGRRPVNTILQTALLPTCADGNGENRTIKRAVSTFSHECVRVLYACTEDIALLHAVPMLLLILHCAVEFAPSAIADETLPGDPLSVAGFMNYLILYYTRQLFPRKQRRQQEQFVSAGFSDRDDTRTNFEDENEDSQALTHYKIYLYYTVLHAFSVLELIASNHSGTDVPDDDNSFWKTVSHNLFVELLSDGSTVPASLLIRVIMLCICSVRPNSVGSLDYLLVSGEARAQKRARLETQLFYVISSLLLANPSMLLPDDSRSGGSSYSGNTAKYLFFSGINELVPSTKYISFSTFYQQHFTPATSTTAYSSSASHLSVSDSRYRWNQVFRLPVIDSAVILSQTTAVQAALQRCALQFFATVLNTLNPRTIYGNNFIILAIVTCMATALDRIYARVSYPSSGVDVSGSNDCDVLVVSDCVRLLHGTMRLSPDYVSVIAGLPGGTSYDHFVSLVRLQFESPATVTVAGAEEGDPDNDLSGVSESAKSSPLLFDAETLRKVQELLENTLTEDEANELYASDLF